MLAVLIGGGVLAYRQATLMVATVASGIGLLVLGKIESSLAVNLFMTLAWVVWLCIACLNFRGIRYRLVSQPALTLFRNLMPTISKTEQDALDAGTVWWDAELFSGDPNWRLLLNLPKENLTPAEVEFLDGPVEKLCGMVNEWEISHKNGDLPAHVWKYIEEQGFLGLIIPEDYGGKGFSARAHSRIVCKIASRCSTAAISVMVPNSLGPAELLLKYGDSEQKDYYLPRLARGEEIPCFALTNPLAGSDAAAIPDCGIVCHGDFRGKEVLGIRLTWEKRYITLSPIATVLGLAFHLYDPEHLIGRCTDVGITLALLPTDHPGVETGRRHFPARQAFLNGPTSGTDVFIPLDWVIGGQDRCGDGWRMLMNCLAAGRSISLPGSSTAGLKVCARTTGAYARLRRQFNLPIGEFEGVQEAISRIVENTYLIDSARSITAGALDAGEEPAVLSAVLKYESTERLRRSINDAMDVHGGRAICDGPANYLMSSYIAAPVGITVEGANILTRSMITFGQGAMRCHPWLLSEIAAAKEENEAHGLDIFDKALFGHIGSILSNIARSFVRNVSGGRIGSNPSVGEVNYWYAQLERVSVSFATVADFALIQLGGALKRKEKLSGRFADVLGEMYLLSCALKRFEDDGQPDTDLLVLEFAFTNSLHRIFDRLDEIIANLPSRSSAWLLRRCIFPWGRRWQRASDALGTKVSNLLVNSAGFRERLCSGMYFDNSPDDLIGCLEHAVRLMEASEMSEDKIRAAVRNGDIQPYSTDDLGDALRLGVINQIEADQLASTRVALRRAIDVDDFSADELWHQIAEMQQASNAA